MLIAAPRLCAAASATGRQQDEVVQKPHAETSIGGVEPPDDRIQAEQLGVDHQREAQIEIGFVFLETRPLLHELHQIAAMHLNHVVDIDIGHPERHHDLDDQLVARRRGEVRWGAEPVRQLLSALGRDPEAILRAALSGFVGFDQSVALEALERRVHLPHIERPDLSGSRLELLPQLEAVFRALAQEGQEAVTDAHRLTKPVIILSILPHEAGIVNRVRSRIHLAHHRALSWAIHSDGSGHRGHAMAQRVHVGDGGVVDAVRGGGLDV